MDEKSRTEKKLRLLGENTISLSDKAVAVIGSDCIYKCYKDTGKSEIEQLEFDELDSESGKDLEESKDEIQNMHYLIGRKYLSDKKGSSRLIQRGGSCLSYLLDKELNTVFEFNGKILNVYYDKYLLVESNEMAGVQLLHISGESAINGTAAFIKIGIIDDKRTAVVASQGFSNGFNIYCLEGTAEKLESKKIIAEISIMGFDGCDIYAGEGFVVIHKDKSVKIYNAVKEKFTVVNNGTVHKNKNKISIYYEDNKIKEISASFMTAL